MSAGTVEYDFLKPTLHRLLVKTHEPKADWFSDGDMVGIRLPTGEIRLEGKTNDPILVRIVGANGAEIGRAVVSPGDDNYNDAEQIRTAAHQAAVRKILDRFNVELDSNIFPTATTATTTTPPPSERPTNDQAAKLFQMIRGPWHLDYGRGEEDLDIDENGNVFVTGKIRGQPATRTVLPKFRLELLECNSSLTEVEIAKVELNGKLRQIEVLQIGPNAMIGYAKHDGHPLKYARRQ